MCTIFYCVARVDKVDFTALRHLFALIIALCVLPFSFIIFRANTHTHEVYTVEL